MTFALMFLFSGRKPLFGWRWRLLLCFSFLGGSRSSDGDDVCSYVSLFWEEAALRMEMAFEAALRMDGVCS